MFTNTFSNKITLTVLSVVALTALFFMGQVSGVSAATYAYVDAAGDVKSVMADDWMSALKVAPNIHIHSGVMLLLTAADFTVVGDTVVGY